jgi:hypothetical protein
LLTSYFTLTAPEAVVLLRAARSYQSGLWVAEDDPEYAWLKFVSAIEVVADLWSREDDDPVGYLQSWDANFTARLHDLGQKKAVDLVAHKLVGVTRSTHKFIEFLRRFAPDPPGERPEPPMRVDWEQLPVSLRMIYKYRSSALHGGKPFPGPLLNAPIRVQNPEERPFGLGSAEGDSVWMNEDLPMHLHVFERIARRAAAVPAASAHVHAGTPLSQCTVDNANSGGNGTNGTPADDANLGPIAGFIPRDTGNAPFPDGPGAGPGFGKGNCP